MEGYWMDFYIIMGTFAVVGIVSGIFANSIKKAMSKLEYLANGKVTDHHSYIPYD
ncbi:hypothetical protein SAMN05660649_01075 [Desulfotomaculum arcticum]|uniref:Uncharacterized protein n=1 Tax=Desulfotruncus arcticus DSM 17038 TaxID=1121424 RepID=A0A1I2QD21_9FIRM|nr:hypothetical protein [Desulfotruncus arcticus]SFG23511.1 hypothetical protein SAMN05660649_01075 [Desulfotomaculum arcticum] [Desulfotruncus arcticus DSM 17038]